MDIIPSNNENSGANVQTEWVAPDENIKTEVDSAKKDLISKSPGFNPFKYYLLSQRAISLVIVIIFIAFMIITSGTNEGNLLYLTLFIFPLGCIWFGDDFGEYTGINFGNNQITSQSPGWLIKLGGWFLIALFILWPYLASLYLSTIK